MYVRAQKEVVGGERIPGPRPEQTAVDVGTGSGGSRATSGPSTPAGVRIFSSTPAGGHLSCRDRAFCADAARTCARGAGWRSRQGLRATSRDA